MKGKVLFFIFLLVCFTLVCAAPVLAASKKADTKKAAVAETATETVTAAPAAAAETTAKAVETPAPVVVSETQKLLSEAQELSVKDQFSAARPKIEKALALEPKNSAIMRSLIENSLVSGDDVRTKKDLLAAISSDDFKDLQDWATMRYYELADKKEGVAEALKTLEAEAVKNPNNEGLQMSIAEGNVKLRNWNAVAGVYEGLLKKKPGDYILTTRLIDVYLINGNYDPVIKMLEPKVKANPKDTASSDLLGRAYVGARMSKEALALYKARVDAEPNSPGLRGTYAMALSEFGMASEAAKEFEKAYQLDPLNKFFKQKADELNAQLGKK